jgi:hypothetical protein
MFLCRNRTDCCSVVAATDEGRRYPFLRSQALARSRAFFMRGMNQIAHLDSRSVARVRYAHVPQEMRRKQHALATPTLLATAIR